MTSHFQYSGVPGIARAKDSTLRWSLLIKSGANVVEVAGQLGHSASTCLGTYAHELDAFVGQPAIDVEAEIRWARRVA